MDTSAPPSTGDAIPSASFNLTIAGAPPGIESRLRAALGTAGLDFRLHPVGTARTDLLAGPVPPGEVAASDHLPTLLLVDDEYNIPALRRVLRREGYRILAATGGEPALRLLAENDVDVIVSDQRMLLMTGVEFLRRARAVRPHAVRIVLSGYSEFQTIADAINEGAIYRFLSKPWEDDLLLAHIREAFAHNAIFDQNRQLQRELAATNAAMSSANAILHALLTEEQARGDRGEATLAVVQEVLQFLPTPIVGIDIEDQVVLANRAAERLFDGVPILGANAYDALPARLMEASDDSDASVAVDCGGNRYTVATHAMGGESRSRGRLLVLTPAPAAPA